MTFGTLSEVLIFLMHNWAPHLFISLPQSSSDIHKRRVFGVKQPIRLLWMWKGPSRCTVLLVGQRLLLYYWSPHCQGASEFFNFYHVSSSTPQNNMLPLCPFILTEVSEVCKAFSCETSGWIRTAPGTEDVISLFSASVQLYGVLCFCCRSHW